MFARWRTGCLYSNEWKHKHHFPNNDGNCRYCKTELETREHILFYCPAIEVKYREAYIKKVEEALNCDQEDHDLEMVLDLTNERTKNQRRALGKALSNYCAQIEYWA